MKLGIYYNIIIIIALQYRQKIYIYKRSNKEEKNGDCTEALRAFSQNSPNIILHTKIYTSLENRGVKMVGNREQ